MGICRSSCANSSSLEYYDAWGHQPFRRPYRPNGGYRPKDDTKLWMCERGCCSIRWKLDYAEFQNYFKYVEVSPYVVMQDKTQQCDCVMCRGMAGASAPQRRWKDPFALKKESNSPTDGSLTDDEPERPESP
ncbi:hypothetical protein PRIC1_002087 [Phytophthora ramorum]|uniref:uncharacterized protein n=1 Tax=Phytophthora ramorum TaxID=164328 RepID=UPI0030B34A75|nr:hypothetical protein KRP23_1365 [Phytophthora ramorum]KAH7509773.1 hypothetical protein KRP22_1269 [Phytophthora ramorum]